ncbi:MAG TPA: ribosome silencing factor [Actinomycetes bacterium]|nr:ribosome silencing factor [Actinomycetes bacterium]
MTAAAESIDLAVAAAAAAADKLAEDIVGFDVSEQLAIADVFLLCSAPNDRQVRAVVEAVEEALAAQGSKPVRAEGRQQGRWVLLDYIDLVVHVLHAEDRAFYSLERLWRDCPVVPLSIDAEAHR